MDENEARDQLATVYQAQRDSGRPALPLPVTVASALSLGLGVALLGSGPSSTWIRLGTLAIAAALVALAYILPTRYRSKKGLFGYRGQVRQTNIVWALALVTLLVCGLGADSTLTIVYAGLGVVSAVTYFFALRGWGMPK